MVQPQRDINCLVLWSISEGKIMNHSINKGDNQFIQLLKLFICEIQSLIGDAVSRILKQLN